MYAYREGPEKRRGERERYLKATELLLVWSSLYIQAVALFVINLRKCSMSVLICMSRRQLGICTGGAQARPKARRDDATTWHTRTH